MRRFISRFLLGSAGVWLAETFVPNIETDGAISTLLLMGLCIAVGEMALVVLEPGASILLFFLPRMLRSFLLRLAIVAIAAGLITTFTFAPPVAIGLVGTTLLLSLLFLLPFTS